MVKNWALVIGINQYNFLQPLKYAKRDAQLIHDVLTHEAGFEQVFLFSDDSFTQGAMLNSPERANFLQFLQQLSDKPALKPEDKFWFFFSGHGISYNNLDYIMLCDSNPEDIENTAISIDYLIDCLRRIGTNNIFLILDACRQQNKKIGKGIGQHTQEIATQSEIVSILSCSSDEYSYEIDKLQTGAFAHALIEGLGKQVQCATVERLNQYLSFRVPQLVSHYHNSLQTPYTNEDINKSHLIIVSKYANLYDIANLKIEATQAEYIGNIEIAEQLWMQVNTIDSAPDTDKIQAIKNIAQLRAANTNFSSKINPQFLRFSKNGKVTSTWMSQPGLSKQELLTSEIQHISTISISNRDLVDFSEQLIQDDYIDTSTELDSEGVISYQQLRESLAAGNWKQADQETLSIMLKVARREKEGWLNIESINKFPSSDLRTIDQLWLKYSNGRFGFSIQKQLWEDLVNQPDNDYEAWCRFCDCIGWRVNGNWLFYSDLSFNTHAPEGHLPAASVVYLLTSYRGWVVGLFSCLVGFSALMYKLVKSSV